MTEKECYDCLKHSRKLTTVIIENDVKVQVCESCLKEYYHKEGKNYVCKYF